MAQGWSWSSGETAKKMAVKLGQQ